MIADCLFRNLWGIPTLRAGLWSVPARSVGRGEMEVRRQSPFHAVSRYAPDFGISIFGCDSQVTNFCLS